MNVSHGPDDTLVDSIWRGKYLDTLFYWPTQTAKSIKYVKTFIFLATLQKMVVNVCSPHTNTVTFSTH